jgi:hypothetical protein
MLLAGTIEFLDGGAIVIAAQPGVLATEVERGDIRVLLTASIVSISAETLTPLRTFVCSWVAVLAGMLTSLSPGSRSN